MSTQQTGQVIKSAAEIYDEFFVPALFGEWAEPVADAATLGTMPSMWYAPLNSCRVVSSCCILIA